MAAAIRSFFRPSNKADTQWLHDDDLFDQFIDAESLGHNDSKNRDTTIRQDALADLTKVNEDRGLFSNSEEEEDDEGGVDISRSHQQNTSGVHASESALTELNSTVPSEIEDFISLLTCEPTETDFSQETPTTTGPRTSTPFPSTPLTPPHTDVISSRESAKSDRVTTGTVRRYHRKTSSSPAMAQPTSARRGHDHWAQKLEARAESFHEQYQPNPLSPPPSANLGQWEDNIAWNALGFHANQSLHQQQQAKHQSALSNGYASHQTASGQQFAQGPGTPYMNAGSTVDSLVTSPQADRGLSWDSGAGSPFQFSLNTTTLQQSFDDTEVQPWWPPASAPYANANYPPQRRRTIRQDSSGPPMPSHPYDSPTSQSMAGLMISNGGLNSPFSPMSSAPYQQPQNHIVYPSDPVESPPTHRQSEDYRRRRVSSYNSHPNSQSRSSRSSSPTRRARTPSSAHPQQTHNHRRQASRSRSTHRNGASNTSTTSAGIDTHAPNHHRRSKSQSASASSGRSPTKSSSASASAASGQGASFGFVNFTPQDSRRILTGVAPSGSSKTKARREKEAAEKRRKFSMAAARAVLEAGVDVGALEKEGLLGVV